MTRVRASIWVNGAFGKMGTEVIKAINEIPYYFVNGFISPDNVGETIKNGGHDYEVAKDLDSLLSVSEHKPYCVVDFTFAQAGYEAALFCAKNNIHFVSGSTGMSDKRMAEIKTAFEKSEANAIIAPNFSLGVVLMMQFSAEAAPYFDEIEIVESHHVTKLDAPSGTAKATGRMVNEAREKAGKDKIDVNMHSLRMSGAIPHQQVSLSSPGEILRIEHDANNRSCFMPGVIMSIDNIEKVDGVLFSIAPLLFKDEK